MHARKRRVATVVLLSSRIRLGIPVGGQGVCVHVVGGQITVILVPHILNGTIPTAAIHTHRNCRPVGIVPTGRVDNDGHMVTNTRTG